MEFKVGKYKQDYRPKEHCKSEIGSAEFELMLSLSLRSSRD